MNQDNPNLMNMESTTPVVEPQGMVPPSMTPIQPTPDATQPVPEKPKKKHTGCIIAIVIVLILLFLLYLGGKAVVNKIKDIIDDDPINTTEQSDNKSNNGNSSGSIENTVVEGTSNFVNVIFLGDEKSGKNDIMLSISNEYNGDLKEQTAKECEEKLNRGVRIGYAITKVKTNKREYQLIGNCKSKEAMEGMIIGAYQADAAILVVSATDGPTTQTREQLEIANKTGVAQLVVFLNKTNSVSDKSLLDTIEKEIKDLIMQYGYDKNASVIRGDSNKKETIQELIKTLDSKIVSPQLPKEKKLLMSVEDVFSISGQGTVATGRVENGIIKINDEVEIIGYKGTKKAKVKGIEMFKKQEETAEAGDNVGVTLDIEKSDIERGDVIAAPGTIKPVKSFTAVVYILSIEEGGRSTSFTNNYLPSFYFRTADVTGTVTLLNGIDKVNPGDIANISVELKSTLAIEKGTQFSIREGGRTVGAGMVTKIN